MSALQYRRDLDGLRAVAVAIVVIYHAFPGRLPGGFIGVDIFFVLSGYLITKIIDKSVASGVFSVVEFYRRRIIRIFPALVLILAVSFVVGWVLLQPRDFKSLGASLFASAIFVQNINLMAENGYFDVAASQKPLLHIWSLGVEEQFYIFWPILYASISRSRHKFLIISGLTVFSFALSLYLSAASPHLGFYLPITRWWELMVGALISKVEHFLPYLVMLARSRSEVVFGFRLEKVRQILVNILSFIAVAILAYGAVRINSSLRYPGEFALLPVSACALLLVTKSSWLNKRLLSLRSVVWFGLISYPLYLWHFPIIVFSKVYLESATRWVMLTMVMGAVVLAWLTYKFVESPVRFGGLNRFAVRPLIVLMAIIGLGGVTVYFENGFPSRWPAELQKYVLTGEETSQYWRRGKCLLLPEQNALAFAEECSARDVRPEILLWGDSFAAALYPGFLKYSGKYGYSISEYTSSACPPLINFVHPEREHCNANNSFVINYAEKNRPQIVVLHSTWMYGFESAIAKYLPDTISRLKKIGVERIIVIGPVPMWSGKGLSANTVDYYFSHGRKLIPERTTYRLELNPEEIKIKELSERMGAVYISASSVLCTPVEGCLARVNDGMELTAFDNGHLTVAGSEYLIRGVIDQIVPFPSFK